MVNLIAVVVEVAWLIEELLMSCVVGFSVSVGMSCVYTKSWTEDWCLAELGSQDLLFSQLD